MKAISIPQPWATLIVCGRMKLMRSWSTSHRGRLAIHATKKPSPINVYLDDDIRTELTKCGFEDFRATHNLESAIAKLNHGRLIGAITLQEVIPIEDLSTSQRKEYLKFGTFKTGERKTNYIWILKQPKRLETPLEINVKRVIFDIPNGNL